MCPKWPLEASRRPKTGLKMENFHGFDPRTPSGRLFWVDHGGSLPLKPISVMDLGYSVQMNPYNAFLRPLEASKRPKTGIKVENFHGFEPRIPSGKAFLG